MVIDAFVEAVTYHIPLLNTWKSSPAEHRFTGTVRRIYMQNEIIWVSSSVPVRWKIYYELVSHLFFCVFCELPFSRIWRDFQKIRASPKPLILLLNANVLGTKTYRRKSRVWCKCSYLIEMIEFEGNSLGSAWAFSVSIVCSLKFLKMKYSSLM